MDNFKRFLAIVGAIAVLLFLVLLILGIKIAGTIFVWIIGALAVIFFAGWVIYLIGKVRGERKEISAERNSRINQ